jgi:hypothetical protein
VQLLKMRPTPQNARSNSQIQVGRKQVLPKKPKRAWLAGTRKLALLQAGQRSHPCTDPGTDWTKITLVYGSVLPHPTISRDIAFRTLPQPPPQPTSPSESRLLAHSLRRWPTDSLARDEARREFGSPISAHSLRCAPGST